MDQCEEEDDEDEEDLSIMCARCDKGLYNTSAVCPGCDEAICDECNEFYGTCGKDDCSRACHECGNLKMKICRVSICDKCGGGTDEGYEYKTLKDVDDELIPLGNKWGDPLGDNEVYYDYSNDEARLWLFYCKCDVYCYWKDVLERPRRRCDCEEMEQWEREKPEREKKKKQKKEAREKKEKEEKEREKQKKNELRAFYEEQDVLLKEGNKNYYKQKKKLAKENRV